MKKFLTKIIGASLAIAMMIGVGAGLNANKVATEANADSATMAAGSNSVAINVSHNNADAVNGVRIGTSGSNGSATFTVPVNTASVSFYAVGWNGKATTISIAISVGTISPSSWELTSNSAASGTINANATVNITENNENCFNTFTTAGVISSATVTISSSGSNRRSIVWGASYTVGSGQQEDAVAVSLDKSDINLDLYNSASSSLTPTVATVGNATAGLTAESSDEAVVTIDDNEITSGTPFTVTGHTVGNAVITVKSTWDESVHATCNIHVADTTPTFIDLKKISALQAGQQVLIATVVNDSYYYLPSTTTNSSPAAISCSYNATSQRITHIDDRMTFTVGGQADAWTFKNSENKYLSVANSGTGVKVNTTDDTFTVSQTEHGFSIKSNATNRYVGKYKDANDWRSYTDSAYTNYVVGGVSSAESISFWVEAKLNQTISGENTAYTDEEVQLTSNATNPTWSIVEGDTTAAGAQVTSVGLVTATDAGVVKVKATHEDYEDAFFTITFSVRPSQSFVDVNKNSTTGFTGQNETLTFTFGNLNDDLTIVSNNTSIVTVNEPSLGATSGSVQINFVGAGETTVKFFDGEAEKASVAVTVTQSSVTITGMPATSTVFVNGTINLASQITVTATGSYSNNITWESDNEAIATVTAAGVVTGVAEGTTNITVTSESDGNVSATCAITVSRVLFQSVNSFQNGKRYVLATSDKYYLPAATQAVSDTPTAAHFDSVNELTKADAWYASVDAQNHIVFSNTIGNTTYYLNAKDASKGIVIATTVNGYWTLDGEGYLTHSSASRYLCAYNNADFRYYSNKAQANASFVRTFYEYIATAKEQAEEIKTLSALTYDYEQDGDAYTYDNVAIRFGGFMSQTLWNELGVVEFGVFLASADDLHNSIKAEYESALDLAGDDIDDALTILCGEHNGDEDVRRYYGTNPVEATEKQKAFNGVNQEETYYTWTVRKNVTNALTTYYTAVAYVRTATEIIFLDETSESAKHLAVASLARTDNADPAYDSLAYFAAH